MTSTSARLGESAILDTQRALATEWLETDGVGGFASATVAGVATRRYHGLLIAVPSDSPRRHLFLARWDERVRSHPDEPGLPPALTGFALDPGPTTTLAQGALRLTRQFLLAKGRAVSICRWTLDSTEADATGIQLDLAPYLACREVDRLHFRNPVFDLRVARTGDVVRSRPYAALPALVFSVAAPDGFTLDERPRWDEGVVHAADLARGYDGREDLVAPCTIACWLRPGESITIAVSLDEPVADPGSLFARVHDLRTKAARLRTHATRDSAVRARLDRRADDFFQVTAGGRLGICAGYPWFGEWGRDTFLALPGLTLARGRIDQCAKVLAGAIPFLKDGLLPNIFGAAPDDSHYGSVDAALWFARAVDLWRRAGGEHPTLDNALDLALVHIASHYHDGTGLGVAADVDGLLLCGGADLNATWMDAQLPSGPVTPRHGKPVEIEALWCSLLDQVVERTGEDAIWVERRDRAFRAFVAAFWIGDPETGHLADRITPDGEPDPRVRPNMVLAAALPRSPLNDEQRAAVLARCERDLLTPRGLRTLAPDDPEYQGRYGGDVVTRDRAYHQGTVWPWLLGAYVELALGVRGPAGAASLHRLLDGFGPELDRAGLDHVSEVFDGDAPHEPGGTIAQAWNTGELLRAYAMLEAKP